MKARKKKKIPQDLDNRSKIVCDVTGIRKCTLAFVYALRREERRGGQQAGSVKFSRLDLASRQCVKITWSLAAPSPRTTPSRASIAASLFCQRRTHSNAEERIRIRGGGSVAEGFFFFWSRGQSSVCRGGSIAGFFACNDECDLVIPGTKGGRLVLGFSNFEKKVRV